MFPISLALALPCATCPSDGGGDGSGISTFSLSAGTYFVMENGGSIGIVVNHSGDTSVQASVNYVTSDGTALAGSDYTTTTGTLNFGVGVTSLSFTAPIVNDTAREPNETVKLTLSTPSGGATLGAPKAATLTIINND